MHIKFLPHGKGLATAAVDYLVGERDAEGQRRDGVEVLRGNPDMVAAVADSLEFERKYSSSPAGRSSAFPISRTAERRRYVGYEQTSPTLSSPYRL